MSGRACPPRIVYADAWHADRDGGARVHEGLDIFAPRGTAVLAMLGGRVTASTRGREPTPVGGHHVTVRGTDGRTYYYAHLDGPPAVSPAERVQTGQYIGQVGSSGNADGLCPHLHLEIRRNGVALNPYPEVVALDPTAPPGTPPGGV